MSDYLPKDVWTDILVRITAEDLVPCTAVCKEWYSVIKSPDFIHLHMKKSEADQQRNHLLVRYFTQNPDREHYSLRVDATFDLYKKVKFPFATAPFTIVGSINGLVCIFYDNWANRHLAMLWNPMIRKAVSVPEPNITFAPYCSTRVSLGFGFDSVTNDYKIVRIAHIDADAVPPEVEVYSLNTGYWRFIRDQAPNYIVQGRTKHAYVRGAAHWLARTPGSIGSHKNLILSFDMRHETFGEMSVPESILSETNYHGRICLLVYRETISLFHHSIQAVDRCCTMWIMQEYGVMDSWVKQFTVDLNCVMDKAVGIRSNGEVLFSTRGRLVSYNYEDKTTLEIPIRRKQLNVGQVFYVSNYTNTLVLLDKEAVVVDGNDVDDSDDDNDDGDSDDDDYSDDDDGEDGGDSYHDVDEVEDYRSIVSAMFGKRRRGRFSGRKKN